MSAYLDRAIAHLTQCPKSTSHKRHASYLRKIKLVGIEPNPGPDQIDQAEPAECCDGRLLLAEDSISGGSLLAMTCPCCEESIIRAVVPNGVGYWHFVSLNTAFDRYAFYCPTAVSEEPHVVDPDNFQPLVGVEPNPGPAEDAVISLVDFPTVRTYTDAQAELRNSVMHASNGNADQDHFLDGGRTAPKYKSDKGKLTKDIKSLQMPTAGKNWLLQSLDPFSDEPLVASAYPRGSTDRIITQELTQTMVITRPPTLAANALWDVHIITNPFFGGVRSSTGGDTGFGSGINSSAGQLVAGKGHYVEKTTQVGTSDQMPMLPSPVLVHRVPAGQPTFSPVNIAGGAFELGCCDIPNEYISDAIAIDGLGLEVVNTTNALNVGGSVTCYRSPAKLTQSSMSLGQTYGPAGNIQDLNAVGAPGSLVGGVTSRTNADMVVCQRPPQTVSEAALTSGSRTWDAKHGAYQVAVFQEPPALVRPRPIIAAWSLGNATNGADPLSLAQYLVPVQGVGRTQAANLAVVQAVKHTVCPTNTNATSLTTYDFTAPADSLGIIPVQRSGIYFQNLPYETSLRLTVRYYITRAPAIREGQLYTLAKPMPVFEPELWTLYARIANDIPCGCPFTMNPLGEWAALVGSLLYKYGPRIWSTIKGAVDGGVAAYKNSGMKPLPAKKPQPGQPGHYVKPGAKKTGAPKPASVAKK